MQTLGLDSCTSYGSLEVFLGLSKTMFKLARRQLLIGFQVKIKLEVIVTKERIVDAVFAWLLELAWIVLRQ